MNNEELRQQEDQTGVTVSGFTAYSSVTPHYELPIVTGDDKYSPMTTWNGTMEKIDNGLYNAQADADLNKDEIATIKNENDRQDNELDAIREVDKVQTENIAKLMGSVNELKAQDQTILKDLVEQNAMVKALQNDVNDLEKSQDEQDLKLGDIEGKIGAEGEEGTIQADIAANEATIDAHYSGDLTTPYKSNKKLTEDVAQLTANLTATQQLAGTRWSSTPPVATPLPNDKLTRSINTLQTWIKDQPNTMTIELGAQESIEIEFSNLANSVGDSIDFFTILAYQSMNSNGVTVFKTFSIPRDTHSESFTISSGTYPAALSVSITHGAVTLSASSGTPLYVTIQGGYRTMGFFYPITGVV